MYLFCTTSTTFGLPLSCIDFITVYFEYTAKIPLKKKTNFFLKGFVYSNVDNDIST